MRKRNAVLREALFIIAEQILASTPIQAELRNEGLIDPVLPDASLLIQLDEASDVRLLRHNLQRQYPVVLSSGEVVQ
jgi:hypothetical protein